MMAIAQKCSLALSLLPDPIPDSLMEEQCDWKVTAQPSSRKDVALSFGSSVDKKQAKSEHTVSKSLKEPQHTLLTKDQTERHCPARNQKTNADRNKSKYPVTVADHLPSAECLEPHSALTRKEMQEALPKISPLPFFKSQGVRPVSFADAMADFENFMTAGPGRSVEIIRQYGTHDEVNTITDEDHENNADCSAGTDGVCNRSFSKDEEHGLDGIAQSQQSLSSASYPVTSRCMHDSSSSSLDSESEMETEQKTDASASSSLSSAPHPKSPRSAGQAKQNITLRAGLLKPQIKPHHPNNHAQTLQHCKSRSVSKEKRSGLTAKAEKGNWRGHRRMEKEEDNESSQEEGVEGNVMDQDYWRACYQAWEEYYSSSSSAYYYHSHYNWLAAYRMNAVYMMEMMKP